MLDVYSENTFINKEESASFEKNQLNHFWFEEDYYGFVNAFKYGKERVLLDKYSLFSESGRSEVVYNWLQCFSVDALQQELEVAGFSVTSVYADVCGNAYDPTHTEFAVVLEKATSRLV